jgi:hypothetical protein
MVPMPGFGPVNPHILDRDTLRYPFRMNRNRQPLPALVSLDLVAIPPTVFVILNVVIENKQVSPANLVKVTAPGDIRGL